MSVVVGTTCWELVAHAIVSREGRIAAADGSMPPCLHVAEDQIRFRAALNAADVTILGRQGHERHPPEDRRRVVLTSRVAALEGGGAVVFWNPDGTSIDVALARLELKGPCRTAAIAGGTRVMTALLPATDRFDLVVAGDCSIPEGRACLTGAGGVAAIRRRIASAGLRPLPHSPLGSAVLHAFTREPQVPPVSQ